MKEMTLLRVAENEHGTFGVLQYDSTPFALTLERRWLDNKVGESCIPDSVYLCERVMSPRFGLTYEVKNVPGRSQILFHKGNLMDDSHGCILVGEQYGVLNGEPGILASGPGFQELLEKLEAMSTFKLHVVSAIGGFVHAV